MFAQGHDSAWPQDFTWPRRPCWHNHFAAVLSVPGESTVLTCDSSPGLTFSHFSRQVGKTLPADKIPDLDKKAVCDGAAQSHSLWQPLTLWANVAGAGCWHRCRCCQERLETRAKIGRNMKRVMETFTTKARAAQHCPWHMLELGSARHVFHRFPIMELLPCFQKSDNLGIREAQCSWCQHAQLSGVSFRQTCYQRSWVHFFFWAQDRWIDRIKLTRLAQLWHWRLSLLASMVKQSQSYSEANSIALIHACDLCPIYISRLISMFTSFSG